jgi:hypothetical protein
MRRSLVFLYFTAERSPCYFYGTIEGNFSGFNIRKNDPVRDFACGRSHLGTVDLHFFSQLFAKRNR